MVADLQAVVLAGGEGSKMFPLTEGIPKCLLPIANIPMISFVIKHLEKSGLKDIIVVVQASDAAQITQTLQTLFHEELNIEVVPLPEEDDLGTADALREVEARIKGDVLVVSSDIVTDVALHRLLDAHRTYDASFTAMLSPRVQVQSQETPAKVDKKKAMRDPNFGTRDFVAMDRAEGRLIFLSNEADQEQENLSFKKSTLKKYPNLKLESELTDCHLYVMKKWLLQYLCNDNKMENIKSDFVPHILRKQFSKPKKTTTGELVDDQEMSFHDDDDDKKIVRNTAKDIHSYCVDDELTTYLREWSGYKGRSMEDRIKCHCIIADGFCLRVNTLPAYTHMNKELHKLKDSIAMPTEFQGHHPGISLTEKSHIGQDCVVGQLAGMGTNVVVKKSVIGDKCVLGNGVKISNCVIMSNVRIADGCKLQNSIICDNVDIQENCTVTNCQISTGHSLKAGTEVQNEAIVQEEMDFDDDE